MKSRYILIAVIAVAAFLLFDRAMRMDAESICDNNEAAFDGCSKYGD